MYKKNDQEHLNKITQKFRDGYGANRQSLVEKITIECVHEGNFNQELFQRVKEDLVRALTETQLESITEIYNDLTANTRAGPQEKIDALVDALFAVVFPLEQTASSQLSLMRLFSNRKGLSQMIESPSDYISRNKLNFSTSERQLLDKIVQYSSIFKNNYSGLVKKIKAAELPMSYDNEEQSDLSP